MYSQYNFHDLLMLNIELFYNEKLQSKKRFLKMLLKPLL